MMPKVTLSLAVIGFTALLSCSGGDVQSLFSGNGTSGATSGTDTNSSTTPQITQDTNSQSPNITTVTSGRAACKRGISAEGAPSLALTANELATFAPNVAWWYNWRIGPGTAAIPAADEAHALDFVPMIWTAPFDSNAIAANITPTTKYLLTFNEPNFTSQGNLTPAQAASYWPQIEALADEHNLLIVSPALNFCAGGCNEPNALVWLDEFFAACANCRVDYLALHAYVCYDAPLRSVYLDPFYQRYGKQIWLTEFSCGDGGADASQVSVQKTYMQAAVADLESNDAVFRYSWFIAKLDATSPAITLLDQNGKLTELGEFYVNLPQSCTP